MAANQTCSCTPVLMPCCTPVYIMETPMMAYRDAAMPFWVWIVVAAGALLVLIILIFIIVLLCLCRARRNYFWCCCFDDDDNYATTFADKEAAPVDLTYGRRVDCGRQPQIMYRFPEDDLTSGGLQTGPETNGDYIPCAHRLTSGRSRAVDDGLERSVIGGPVITEYIDVDDRPRPANSQLAVVNIGRPSSAIGGPTRPPSVMGAHSASIQVGSGGAAVAHPVNIWPAL